MHFIMLHSSTEAERHIKGLAFSMVLNYIYGDWNFPKAAILAPKIFSSSLYTCAVLGSFDEKICTFQ